MKKTSYLFFILISLGFKTNAHDVAQWCSTGTSRVTDLGQVSLTQGELVNAVSEGVNCLVGPADSATFQLGSDQENMLTYISPVIFRQHGQLDDPDVPNFAEIESEDIRYRIALAYAYCTCATMASLKEIDPDLVNVNIETPDAIGSNHHELFDFSNGFRFSCQLCSHRHD